MYHLYRDPKFIVLLREPVEKYGHLFIFYRGHLLWVTVMLLLMMMMMMTGQKSCREVGPLLVSFPGQLLWLAAMTTTTMMMMVAVVVVMVVMVTAQRARGEL